MTTPEALQGMIKALRSVMAMADEGGIRSNDDVLAVGLICSRALTAWEAREPLREDVALAYAAGDASFFQRQHRDEAIADFKRRVGKRILDAIDRTLVGETTT